MCPRLICSAQFFVGLWERRIDARIEPAGLDVVALLVGLATAEHRAFQLQVAEHVAQRHHPVGDVRRVEPVMRDRRLGIVLAGEAVHERGRAESRLSRQPGVDECRAALRQAVAVRRRQLHEQVVRMLPVDQWRLPVGRLAGLQEERIAAFSECRIGGDHGAQAQRSGAAHLPVAHHHQHAGHERLGVASRAALVVVDQVDEAVRHGVPVAEPGVDAFVRRGVRLPAGAGGFTTDGVRAEPCPHRVLFTVRGVLSMVLRHRLPAHPDGSDHPHLEVIVVLSRRSVVGGGMLASCGADATAAGSATAASPMIAAAAQQATQGPQWEWEAVPLGSAA